MTQEIAGHGTSRGDNGKARLSRAVRCRQKRLGNNDSQKKRSGRGRYFCGNRFQNELNATHSREKKITPTVEDFKKN